MPTADYSSYHQPSGTGADGSKLDNFIDAVQATVNGLDNNNFAAGKIFDPLKFMQDAAVDGDCMVWSTSASGWVPATTRKMLASSISGYPTDATKFLRGDGTWAAPATATTYRKVTSKAVTNTVSETDLFNGEITLAANALAINGVLRLTAWGDFISNAGTNPAFQRFKFKLGTTVLIDTGTGPAAGQGASASRFGWRIVVEVMNLGAANSQWIRFRADLASPNGTAGSGVFTAGEGVYYTPTNGGTTTVITAEGSNTGAIDTTASQAIVLSVINPTATATFETKLYGALVEVV